MGCLAGLLGASGSRLTVSLLGPADVRRLAERYGVRPTKRRGQNFVVDANTVRRIVATADLRPGDAVLEVGPGLGSLTLGLLSADVRVTAVEVEPILANALPQTVAEFAPERRERLQVVAGDALRVSTLPGPPPTALVANLPYNVAVPVLLHLLATFASIERMLVMVQREVAERLAAAPGSRVYGVPGVKAAWYAQVRLAGSVSRSVFWPAPRVDAGLVALVRRPAPVTTAGRLATFAVIDAAFSQRRKMLRAALADHAGSAVAATRALEAAGVAPTARGEQLTVVDFARIADALHTPHVA